MKRGIYSVSPSGEKKNTSNTTSRSGSAVRVMGRYKTGRVYVSIQWVSLYTGHILVTMEVKVYSIYVQK